MSYDSLIAQTREALTEVLPETVEVTDVELEGPHVVLYTKQLDAFLNGGDLLRQVASVAATDDTRRAADRAGHRLLRGVVAASSQVSLAETLEAPEEAVEPTSVTIHVRGESAP